MVAWSRCDSLCNSSVSPFRLLAAYAVLAGEPCPCFGALFTKIRQQPTIARYFIGHVTISFTWILRRKGGLLVHF